MKENEENKVKLEGIQIYSNENCPYCNSVKAEFKKQEIEFEDKDTVKFNDEWEDVIRLTGLPSIPTIKYKGEFFVPGRDFPNPTVLIQVLSNYKPCEFDSQTRIIEKLATLNFQFSQSINNMFMRIQNIETKVTELHDQLIEKPEIKEENEHKSTD